MLLLVAHALAADPVVCARNYDTTEVIDAATSAESAFGRLDAKAVAAARGTMESRLTCLGEIVSPAAVARVERVEALSAFVDGRPEQVPLALAGLFSAEPGHQIPTALIPEGHPIRDLIAPAMLLLRDDPGAVLPVPTSGWIEVDGAHALLVPTQRAAVLQQIDGQGQVVATHFRWPDEVGYTWVVTVAASTAPAVASSKPAQKTLVTGRTTAKAPPPPSSTGPWTHRAPLIGVAVASLAASAALYAVAADDYHAFDASPVQGADATAQERADYLAQLQAMQAKTNPLTYACWAAGGVGIALGVGTVVTW